MFLSLRGLKARSLLGNRSNLLELQNSTSGSLQIFLKPVLRVHSEVSLHSRCFYLFFLIGEAYKYRPSRAAGEHRGNSAREALQNMR